MFATGWSACFETAIALALDEVTIDAEIDLHLSDDTGYFLSARLNVSIPGIDRVVARDLVYEAEQICPYSKATRGNVDVTLNVLAA
jgi:lipoyl-dependent peroxiredoxin